MYIELITGVLEMFHVVVATGWQQDHMLFAIGTHCILREVGQETMETRNPPLKPSLLLVLALYLAIVCIDMLLVFLLCTCAVITFAFIRSGCLMRREHPYGRSGSRACC